MENINLKSIFFNSDIFIKVLESEIIPNIFQDIKLPNLPSLKKLKSYGYHKDRISKHVKYRFDEKNPFIRTHLIQEIAYLKKKLNGYKINVSQSEQDFKFSNESMKREKIDKFESIPDKLNRRVLHYTDSSDLIPTTNFSRSSISFRENEVRIIQSIFLEFSEKFKDEIFTNDYFMEFITQIEIALNNFVNHSNQVFSGRFNFQEDFEIKDVKKIILNIDIKNLNIEEKLEFWDRIEMFLRKHIENCYNSLSDNAKNNFIEFNERFYTNIILN
jgi:hypothetical protein